MALPLGDDTTTGFIDIGFDFDFYGTAFNSVRVNANGFLSFAPEQLSSTYITSELPSPASNFDSMIAGFWEDLNNPAGNIRYQTLGAQGDRRFVVGYYDVPHFLDGPLTSFEIVLHETSNNITFNYINALGDGDLIDTVIGLENADGSDGFTIARGDLNLSNISYRITHPSALTTWALNSSGSWDTPTNWSGGQLPGAGSFVSINQPGTITVTGPTAPAAIENLHLGGGGANSLVIGPGSSLLIAETLRIEPNSALVINQGTVAASSIDLSAAGQLIINDGVLELTGGVFDWNVDSRAVVTGQSLGQVPRIILSEGSVTTYTDNDPTGGLQVGTLAGGSQAGAGVLRVIEGSQLFVNDPQGLQIGSSSDNSSYYSLFKDTGTRVVVGADGHAPLLVSGTDTTLWVQDAAHLEAGQLTIEDGASLNALSDDARVTIEGGALTLTSGGGTPAPGEVIAGTNSKLILWNGGLVDVTGFTPGQTSGTFIGSKSDPGFTEGGRINVQVSGVGTDATPSTLRFSGDLDLIAAGAGDSVNVSIFNGGVLDVAGHTAMVVGGTSPADEGSVGITVNGGVFRTGSLSLQAPSIDEGIQFTAGQIEIGGDLTLDQYNIIRTGGIGFMVDADRALTVGGVFEAQRQRVHVLPGGLLSTGEMRFTQRSGQSTLAVQGGTLQAGALTRLNDADFDFTSGLIHVTGGAITGWSTLEVGNTVAGERPELRLSEGAWIDNASQGDLDILHGLVTVRTGSLLQHNNIHVGKLAGVDGELVIREQDPQQFLAQVIASNDLVIGGTMATPGGNGRVEVAAGGNLYVPGTLKIWGHGTNSLVMNGGTLLASNIDLHPGASVNWLSGSINLTNDLLIGTGGALGQTVTLNNPASTLGVAGTTTVAGDGALTINGGSMTTGSLALQAGSTFTHTTGDLTVEGGNFTVPADTDYIMGANVAIADQPTLTLSQGAVMTVDDGLIVGDTDALYGTVNVQSFNPTQTSAIDTAFFSLGNGPASRGTMNVFAGGQLNAPFLSIVGAQGYGQLTISQGNATTSGVIAGLYPGSDGNVSVFNPGAHWTATGTTYFGSSGSGYLLISNGGTVDAEDIWVAQNPGSDGTIFVGGFGAVSTLNVSDDLFLGGVGTPGGTGIIHINNAGVVDITDTLTIYGSTGTELRLQGGELRVGSIDLQGTVGQLTDQWTAGTLAITGTQGLTLDNTGVFGPLLNLSDQQNLESTSVTVGDTAQLSLASGASLDTPNLWINSGIGNEADLRLDAAYNGDSGATVTATATVIGLLGGFDGAGDNTLTIQSGSFEAQSLLAGVNTGANGLVTVGFNDLNTASATLNVTGASPVILGLSGRGELEVLRNGTASFQDALILGANSGGSGMVTVNAGQLNVSGDLQLVGANSSLAITSGNALVGGTLSSANANPISLTGGLLSVGQIDFGGNASVFNWQSGVLAINAQETIIQEGADLGEVLNLVPGKALYARQVVVGDHAIGRLDLMGGTLQSLNDGLTIGRSAGSGGSLVTVGAVNFGFALNVYDDIIVGQGALARMEITDGGTALVHNGGLLLATQPGAAGSSLEVSGDASLLDLNNALIVGGQAEATAVVSGGGAIEVAQGITIAQGDNIDNASLWIQGTGTRVSADSLAIAPGQNSFGEVSVDSGALLSISGDATVGALTGNSGGGLLWVNGDQATVDIGGNLTLVPSGTGSEQSALSINQGALVDVDAALIANASGVIQLNDGTLRVNEIDAFGRLSWDVGLLDITGTSLNLAEDIATNYAIDTGKRLRVAGELAVGGSSSTQLSILGGGLVEAGSAAIGTLNTVPGHGVAISDAGSQWTVDDDLVLGQAAGGSPTLQVISQGALNVGGRVAVVSTAAMTLDQGILQANRIDVLPTLSSGTNFSDFYGPAIVLEGFATLTDGDFNLGTNTLNPGQLEVIRNGSNRGLIYVNNLLASSNSEVFFSDGLLNATGLVQSYGRFEVTQSSTITAADLTVSGLDAGNDQYGVMRVDGVNTNLEITDTTRVGAPVGVGAGLFISGNAEVHTGTTTHVGAVFGDRGQLTLAGADTLWHAAGDVHAGGLNNIDGTGLISIGGGLAQVDGVLHVHDTGDTLVSLLGGKLKADSINTHGNSSRFDWQGGALELNTFTVGSSGPLGSNVIVDGLRPGLTILGNTVVAPDGQLTLDGDAVFTTGGLDTSNFPNNFAWGSGTLNLTAADLPIGTLADPLGFDVQLTSGRTLLLREQGVVSVGLVGQLQLGEGGYLRAGSLNLGGDPARFDWTGGGLELTNSGLTVSPAGPLGASVIIPDAAYLSLSDELVVGNNAAGNLVIGEGAYAESSQGKIGVGASAGTSLVQVGGAAPADPAYWTIFGDLAVGGGGTSAGHNALLTVNETGIVQAQGALTIHGTTGQVTLNGGQLIVGELDTDADPTGLNWNSGLLKITNGDLQVDSAGQLGGNLVIDSSRTLDVLGTLRIGDNSPAQLLINGAGLVKGGSATIGAGLASSAQADVVGPDAQWLLSGSVTVGNAMLPAVDDARLNIDGGTVRSQSTVYINEHGGLYVFNGGELYTRSLSLDSDHTLSITNGLVEVQSGSTQFDTLSIDGGTLGNIGTMRLIATSTGQQASEVTVGTTGHAIFEVLSNTSSGATFNSFGTATIAQGSQATGEVTVAGRANGSITRWNHAGTLIVGDLGDASMHVTAQGRLNSQDAFVGNQAGSTGSVIIDGGGSAYSTWDISGSLYIGGNDLGKSGAEATVSVGHRSQLLVDSDLVVYDNGLAGPSLMLNDPQGIIQTGQLLTDGRPDNFAFSAGTLRLTSTGLGLNPTGPLGADLTLNADMTLDTSSGGNVVVAPDGSLTMNAGSNLITQRLDASAAPTNFTWNGGNIRLTNTSLNVGPTGDLGDTLTLGPDHNLTLTSGGVTIESGGQINLVGGQLVTQNLSTQTTPSRLNWTSGELVLTSDTVVIGPGSELGRVDLSGGKALTIYNVLQVNGPGTPLTLGDQSSLSVSGTTIIDGSIGVSIDMTPTSASASWSSGAVRFTGATGSAQMLVQATSTTSASLSTGSLWLATETGGSAAVTLDGEQVSWSANGETVIGGTSTTDGGAGTLDVINGASFNTGQLHIRSGTGSVVRLDGGRINATSLNTGGSPSGFNWVEGDLTLGSLLVGSGGPLGNSLTLDNLHRLVVNGTTTVADGGLLKLNEGTFSTGLLDLQSDASRLNWAGGELVFAGNTTSVIDRSGNLGETWTIDGGKMLSTSSFHRFEVGSDDVGLLNILDGTVTTGLMTIGRDALANGQINVSGTGALLATSNTSSGFAVGDAGNGTLVIDAAATATSYKATIGRSAGSTGRATVTGLDSSWSLSNVLLVGASGDGQLRVLDHATLTAGNITVGSNTIEASLEVGGAGSIQGSSLALGSTNSALGVVELHTGGQVTLGGNATIGSAGSGILNLATGAQLNASALTVGASGTGTIAFDASTMTLANSATLGQAGQGTLDVTGGGTLNIGEDLVLGAQAFSNGVASFSGSGTLAEVGGLLQVGLLGKGELYVNQQAIVQSDSAQIGFGDLRKINVGAVENDIITTFGDGLAIVNGVASTWDVATLLEVGTGGPATMIVRNGAQASAADIHVGIPNVIQTALGEIKQAEPASILIDGQGSVIQAERMVIGGNGVIDGGIGLVIVRDQGSLIVTEQLTISAGGQLSLSDGSLQAAAITLPQNADLSLTQGRLSTGQIDGGLIHQGGTLAPGNSPGTTQIDGDYNMTSTNAILEIELGGRAPGTGYDNVVVSGSARLSGTLELSLIDGFIPGPGSSFTILSSSSLLGTTFDDIMIASILPGIEFEVAYSATDVIVSAVVLLPGDTDGDGDVDDSDLGTSFSNYTGPVGAAGNKTAADGDTDGDGDVDDSDLGTSFSGYTGPIAPVNIPEPTSFALLGFGGLLLARRRRRA